MTNLSTRTDEPQAYTVASFCKAHSISRSFFYQLLKERAGPRVMKVGTRTLVSREAATEWRKAQEQSNAIL